MHNSSPSQGSAVSERRWLALAVLLAAASMNLIDLTIVSVAMPAIQHRLHATAAETEWILAAYALPFALGLITGGRLGDIFGRRRMFLIGVLGFTLASIVCGAASSTALLIAGRAVQGIFAAAMMPQVLASIHVLFTGKERGKALGMWGSVLGLATIGSPILGALLLKLGLHWRPIFLVNVPVGAIALAGALAWLPESRSEHPLRIDLGGVALCSLALLLLCYPLIEGRQLGWPAWTFVMIAASIPAFAAFAVYQRGIGEDGSPLVPMGLFAERGFSAGVVLGLVFFSGIVGFGLVLQLALQNGLGFSAMHGALTVLPFSVGIVIASPFGMQLVGKLGRRLIFAGAGLMVLGSVAVIIAVRSAGSGLSTLDLVPGMLICGFGVGTVAPSLVSVALAEVRGAEAGAASGLIGSANQVGSAIGVATMGAIFFALLPKGGVLHPAHDYITALSGAMWYELGVFALSLVLALLLPAAVAPAAAGAGTAEGAETDVGRAGALASVE
ncbi:MAG TPA: MFS transporter [Solirubrobacteraceae bacterium]|jgi:EmrB/QacA subfamily drug resistance transporter|nr:MFS transporter [Solirubrobacteraceae bacterium]